MQRGRARTGSSLVHFGLEQVKLGARDSPILLAGDLPPCIDRLRCSYSSSFHLPQQY